MVNFVGYVKKISESLAVLIEAARIRNEALDHLLFFGVPGLGKTTLANIVANEMGVSIKVVSGLALERRDVRYSHILAENFFICNCITS